jgi:ribosomal protein L11 methyltransferase
MPEEGRKRAWQVVQFNIAQDQEELAGWLMMHMGAIGCEIQPTTDDKSVLKATFTEEEFSADHLHKIQSALEKYGLNSSLPSLKSGRLQEEDWLAKWKEGFDPFEIGPHLIVSPIWHEKQASTRRQTILIDPGLAFGTGFHFTTRFCLQSLQDYVDDANRILDVGTGSGILAIGAALLNRHACIVALDSDPVACANARENVQHNHVQDRIELLEGDTGLLKNCQPFDLILSNLTCEDHITLLAEYCRLASETCNLILAGILTEKLDRLKTALSTNQLCIKVERADDIWTGLVVGQGR